MEKFKLNCKSFFQTTKYEFIRLARNKVLLAVLLIFSIALIVLISNVSISSGIKIAFYANGKTLDEVQLVDVLDEYFAENDTIIVSSEEEGLDMIKDTSARLFISIDITSSPETATIYYDSSNIVSTGIIGGLTGTQNELSYTTLKEFLLEYGIEINEEYFKSMSFTPVTGERLNGSQMAFANAITIAISIVIMFGLSYSISRDNETHVSKNLAYLPISANKYLLSKLTPYVTMGLLELSIVLILGHWLYDINFQINVFIILLLSTLFIISCATLGLLLSLCSSQITSTLLQISSVLIPSYMLTIAHLENAPIIFREIMYLLPSTLYNTFLNCMMFNGTILWWMVGLFIIQAIGYYLISYFIIRRRSRT